MGNERKVQSAEGYNVGDEVVVKNLNATITEIVEKPRFDGSYKEYWFVVEFEDQELSDDMVRSYALKKRPSAMSSRVSFS
jgi:predicted transcriptional regulator of viral defense system